MKSERQDSEAGHRFNQRCSCFRQAGGGLHPLMEQIKGRDLHAWWVGAEQQRDKGSQRKAGKEKGRGLRKQPKG